MEDSIAWVSFCWRWEQRGIERYGFMPMRIASAGAIDLAPLLDMGSEV